MRDVVRPGDRQEPVCVLWRQLYLELDFDFVFGPDACFSGRLDAEISLLDRGLATEPLIAFEDFAMVLTLGSRRGYVADRSWLPLF